MRGHAREPGYANRGGGSRCSRSRDQWSQESMRVAGCIWRCPGTSFMDNTQERGSFPSFPSLRFWCMSFFVSSL